LCLALVPWPPFVGRSGEGQGSGLPDHVMMPTGALQVRGGCRRMVPQLRGIAARFVA